jgi:hypothetical protein
VLHSADRRAWQTPLASPSGVGCAGEMWAVTESLCMHLPRHGDSITVCDRCSPHCTCVGIVLRWLHTFPLPTHVNQPDAEHLECDLSCSSMCTSQSCAVSNWRSGAVAWTSKQKSTRTRAQCIPVRSPCASGGSMSFIASTRCRRFMRAPSLSASCDTSSASNVPPPS